MAVNDPSDPITPLLGTWVNHRQAIWIWLGLHVHENFDLDGNSCGGATMRDVVAQALKGAPDIASDIRAKKDRYLLPEELLTWITSSQRQLQWLTPKIDNLTDRILPRGLVHLQGRDRLVAALDLWQVDLEEKDLEVERLSGQWRRHIAKDSQFEWFTDKKEGTKRCICAWEWIQKNPLDSVPRPLPIGNYNDLLLYFDQAELDRHGQKAVIQEIKKRWSRQQFSERNADKRQVNAMLPHDLIYQIDELAQKHGLKQREVIEALLRKGIESRTFPVEPQGE